MTTPNQRLMEAVRDGSLNGAHDALKEGATPCDETFRALHFAVSIDRSFIASTMLDRGFPVDARDTKGRTPLHMAI